MITGVLLVYILLFSLGCGGAVSLGIFYKCLGNRVIRRLLVVFLVLLFSLLRIIAGTFYLGMKRGNPLSPLLQGLLSTAVILVLYFALYLVLRELKGVSLAGALFPTLGVVLVQLGRMGLYYFLNPPWLQAVYLPSLALISAYLFYTGLALNRGCREGGHYSLRKLLKGMGRLTILFSPLSLLFYIVWYALGMRERLVISLDFVYLLLWSLVCLFVLLDYLTRMGRLPSEQYPDGEVIALYGFTPRETEVLEQLMKGMTNREIGEALFISPVTVRTHVSRLMDKTDVRNRVELVAKMSRE